MHPLQYRDAEILTFWQLVVDFLHARCSAPYPDAEDIASEMLTGALTRPSFAKALPFLAGRRRLGLTFRQEALRRYSRLALAQRRERPSTDAADEKHIQGSPDFATELDLNELIARQPGRIPQAIRLLVHGYSRKETARKLGVADRTLGSWLASFRKAVRIHGLQQRADSEGQKNRR